MGTNENYTSIIDYYYRTATANSEEDVDYLLKVMNPTDDKDEMGKAYNKVLGYDPITYFDKTTLRAKLFEVCGRLSNEAVRNRILEDADDIIDDALEARTKFADKLWPLFIIKGALDVLNPDDVDEILNTLNNMKGDLTKMGIEMLASINLIDTMESTGGSIKLESTVKNIIKKYEDDLDDEDDDEDDEQLDDDEEVDADDSDSDDEEY